MLPERTKKKSYMTPLMDQAKKKRIYKVTQTCVLFGDGLESADGTIL